MGSIGKESLERTQKQEKKRKWGEREQTAFVKKMRAGRGGY